MPSIRALELRVQEARRSRTGVVPITVNDLAWLVRRAALAPMGRTAKPEPPFCAMFTLPPGLASQERAP